MLPARKPSAPHNLILTQAHTPKHKTFNPHHQKNNHHARQMHYPPNPDDLLHRWVCDILSHSDQLHSRLRRPGAVRVSVRRGAPRHDNHLPA